ncbi:MAG: prepilin-type N-terminal cleavage/methylation domain-containing protein [Candidatus Omnitrophica bacterium]|nr:prepilin-type N-terminal cleavage/methylation domain-containing protein [Candidatus Omnitrophota bacterium]
MIKVNTKGFTFFEVMVAIAILTTGLVMIYKAFLLSVDYQGYLTNRLYAMNLLDHKISLIQREYQDKGELPVQQRGEKFEVVLNRRTVTFQFDMAFEGVDGLEDVLEMVLFLSWEDRGKTRKLSRVAYLYRG